MRPLQRSLPCLLLLFSRTSTAQTLIEQDLYYGNALHTRIASSNTLISSGEAYDSLRVIFANLLSTPIVQGGPALPYSFHYLNDQVANAYAGAGGRVYVTQGLTRATNGEKGLQAFALGHEMAHAREHHVVKKFLRDVKNEQVMQWYRKRIALGDQHARTQMGIYVVARAIAEKKIERDDENRADLVGLQIAAQAGYHPDFAIMLTYAMREELPDKSKFMAFFSNHPRWATREQRIGKHYEEALSAFQARWPSVDQSPGGVPGQSAAAPNAVVADVRSSSAPPNQAGRISPTPDLRHNTAALSTPANAQSIWRLVQHPDYKWTFKIGTGLIVADLVLPEELQRLGDFDTITVEKRGDKFVGTEKVRVTFQQAAGKVCQWESAVELTSVTENRIEGRWEAYSRDSNVNQQTCVWSGNPLWKDATWIR